MALTAQSAAKELVGGARDRGRGDRPAHAAPARPRHDPRVRPQDQPLRDRRGGLAARRRRREPRRADPGAGVRPPRRADRPRDRRRPADAVLQAARAARLSRTSRRSSRPCARCSSPRRRSRVLRSRVSACRFGPRSTSRTRRLRVSASGVGVGVGVGPSARFGRAGVGRGGLRPRPAGGAAPGSRGRAAGRSRPVDARAQRRRAARARRRGRAWRRSRSAAAVRGRRGGEVAVGAATAASRAARAAHERLVGRTGADPREPRPRGAESAAIRLAALAWPLGRAGCASERCGPLQRAVRPRSRTRESAPSGKPVRAGHRRATRRSAAQSAAAGARHATVATPAAGRRGVDGQRAPVPAQAVVAIRGQRAEPHGRRASRRPRRASGESSAAVVRVARRHADEHDPGATRFPPGAAARSRGSPGTSTGSESALPPGRKRHVHLPGGERRRRRDDGARARRRRRRVLATARRASQRRGDDAAGGDSAPTAPRRGARRRRRPRAAATVVAPDGAVTRGRRRGAARAARHRRRRRVGGRRRRPSPWPATAGGAASVARGFAGALASRRGVVGRPAAGRPAGRGRSRRPGRQGPRSTAAACTGPGPARRLVAGSADARRQRGPATASTSSSSVSHASAADCGRAAGSLAISTEIQSDRRGSTSGATAHAGGGTSLMWRRSTAIGARRRRTGAGR